MLLECAVAYQGWTHRRGLSYKLAYRSPAVNRSPRHQRITLVMPVTGCVCIIVVSSLERRFKVLRPIVLAVAAIEALTIGR